MVLAITAEELVLILGGYTAVVTVLGGLLLKIALETRSEAKSVNRAVNNRPSDEPPIYERVVRVERTLDRLDKKVERQGDAQTARHFENSGRIREVRDAVSRVEGRVADLEHKGET